MKNHFLFLTLFVFLFSTCEVIRFDDNLEEVGSIEGLRPVYTSSDDWDEISIKSPQPIGDLGKIYYKDSFIYVNERNKGIHIIDNSDPANPIPLHFLEVIGSEDIAIKGNILYADNISDLVAIDISDFNQITVTSRVSGLYPESKRNYPDGYSGYFECVDPERGIVIGWEEAILENPKCLR